MLFIALIVLSVCVSSYGMESNTLITFLPHHYTFDSLEDCGTMEYRTIQIPIFCPSINHYCTQAFNDTRWWKTQFEPKISLYVKKFVHFNRITNTEQNYIPVNTLIGSFCLKIFAITLKKTISKLLKISHYQASIIRTNTFNPEAPTSVFIENNWLEIFENQKTSLPQFFDSFKNTFDALFFDQIKNLIESFDQSIKTIHYSNSDFQKTEKNLKSFLENFDQILASYNQRNMAIIETTFTPFAFFLAYIFDFKS